MFIVFDLVYLKRLRILHTVILQNSERFLTVTQLYSILQREQTKMMQILLSFQIVSLTSLPVICQSEAKDETRLSFAFIFMPHPQKLSLADSGQTFKVTGGLRQKAEAKGLTPIYFAKFDGPDWSLFLVKPDQCM